MRGVVVVVVKVRPELEENERKNQVVVITTIV
jgi:hypothetical protein